jgi:hypothetical protein
MSHGKFTTGYLPAVGDITVTGPFDPDDGEVNFARIVFLVVQGTARNTVVVRGKGVWNRDAGGQKTEWRGTAPRSGDLALGPSGQQLQAGVMTRGIAVSIVVQPGRVLQDGEVLPLGEEPKQGATITFDPPSIEALNWCADVEIVSGDPPPPS